MAHVTGTAGNDFIHTASDGRVAPNGYNDIPGATNGDDIITPGAGNDTIYAGGGDDVIDFQDNLTSSDVIDGGAGSDTLIESGTTFATLNITSVETIDMTGSGGDLQFLSGDLQAHHTLTINAGGADPDAQVFLNAANLNAGRFVFNGGAVGVESISAGRLPMVFNIPVLASVLELQAGGYADHFTINGDLATTTFATIDGGGGGDVLNLSGGLSPNTYTHSPAGDVTISNFAHINLAAGGSYTFGTDEDIDTFQALTVNGSHLGAGDVLAFYAGSVAQGALTLHGGAGDDILYGGTKADTITGGAGNDHIDVTTGGADSVNGGSGNDTIVFGAFGAGDHVEGGGGKDTLIVTGGMPNFDPSAIHGIEVLALGPGYSYSLAAPDSFVPAGRSFTVDASALNAGDSLVYDGSVETDGRLTLLGGNGDDVLTGGAGNDTLAGGFGNDVFNLASGGNDTADGGGGNDVFDVGGAFTRGDRIDGGSGNDTINFDGDYSAGIAFNGVSFVNVEKLHFAAGNDYSIRLNDGNIATGGLLAVDASELGAANRLVFNDSAETSGNIRITGGAGNDHLTTGQGNDSLTGGLGKDTLDSGAGHDVFNYTSVADSTGGKFDIVVVHDLALDHIHLPFLPNAVDATVTSGALSHAGFNAVLASDIGAAQLAAGDAVVFTPDSGDLAGHHFLIVDANGTAGYQANQDYVIEIVSPAAGSIGVGTFV